MPTFKCHCGKTVDLKLAPGEMESGFAMTCFNGHEMQIGVETMVGMTLEEVLGHPLFAGARIVVQPGQPSPIPGMPVAHWVRSARR